MARTELLEDCPGKTSAEGTDAFSDIFYIKATRETTAHFVSVLNDEADAWVPSNPSPAWLKWEAQQRIELWRQDIPVTTHVVPAAPLPKQLLSPTWGL